MSAVPCIRCERTPTHTTDTRVRPEGVRRRRACPNCGHRWTTLEVDYETAMQYFGNRVDVAAALDGAIEVLRGVQDRLREAASSRGGES